MKTLRMFVFVICAISSIAGTRLALALQAGKTDSPGQQVNTPQAPEAKSGATLQNAAQKGLPLTATSNVSDVTAIQAVLIPASLARRVFGREVSENYAVVELIISNQDPKAALVIHGIFLDYSLWTLGNPANSNQGSSPRLDATQTANIGTQVASIESRLVRGEMIDAQQWSLRNWTIRSLTALGAVAAGFEFPFSGDVAKGIASFNGIVVPGASTLWPDGAVNQINRISDFGFQSNKMIPKQGSDILVAFFPINRFLTPSFRKQFLANPAGLFLPMEMIADPQSKDFVKLLEHLFDAGSAENLDSFRKKALQVMLAASCNPNDQSPDCKLQGFLNSLSLSNLRVVLEGVMTVDVASVPATIYSVDFDSGNSDSSIWTTLNKAQLGKISGVFLTNGTPAVVDDAGKAIPGLTISSVTDGSTDNELHFTMELTNCIPPTTKIHFVVNKSPDASSTGGAATAAKQKASGVVASTPFAFTPPKYTCPEAPANGLQDTGTNAPPSGNKTGSNSAPQTPQGTNKKNQDSIPTNPKQQ